MQTIEKLSERVEILSQRNSQLEERMKTLVMIVDKLLDMFATREETQHGRKLHGEANDLIATLLPFEPIPSPAMVKPWGAVSAVPRAR